MKKTIKIIVMAMLYLKFNAKAQEPAKSTKPKEPKDSTLNEVQIIGYGTTTKRSNTGTLSSISSKQIENQPVTNVLSTLSGRMPGVFVQTTNGLPGGNINIQIRGKGSLTAGTNPLYIIDGVPFDSTPINNSAIAQSPIIGAISPLNSLNPADIESITVLKDADATAIYGSRGSNGVILITTKKGKSGSTNANLSINKGFSQAANLPKMLSIADYLQIRKEAFINSKQVPTNINARDLLLWDQNQNTNWPDYLFGHTAQFTEAQASISGGNAGTTFNASASFHQEGNIVSDQASYKRGSLLFSLRHISPNQKFEATFSNALTLDNNQSPNLQYASTGIFLAPNFPMIGTDGKYTLNSGNPLRDANATVKSSSNNILTNLSLSYAFLDQLKFKVSGGYNQIHINQTQLYPLNSLQFGPNYAQYGQNSNQSFIVEPQLNYNTDLGKGKVGILLGGTYQNNSTKSQFIKGINYSNEQLMEDLSSAADIETRTSLNTNYRYLSAFARGTYSLENKYFLNATARRDGSSKFGEGNRFGNFGAIGAAWIFTEEPLFKDLSAWLSYGKLRASYGTTGNDQIPDYQYLSTYSSSGYVYQGFASLAPSRIDNANFHWETTHKLEMALELGFLANRILFNINHYRNRSTDQLVQYTLPYITGFSAYQANLPAVVQNSGWEFELNSTNIQHKDFSWTSTFNITLPKNKLLSFENLETSTYSQTFKIGEDITRLTGYHFLGVNPDNGKAIYAGKDGLPSSSPDANYTLGKATPDFYGGLGNTLNYKRFSIDVFVQFAKQMSKGGLTYSLGIAANNFAYMNKRWQHPGDITNIPAPSTVADSYYSFSSANFFDSSYIRVKNLALSYRLPEAILKGLKVRELRCSILAQNLFTFYNRKGALMDPESGGFSAFQNNISPLKSFAASLNLTF